MQCVNELESSFFSGKMHFSFYLSIGFYIKFYIESTFLILIISIFQLCYATLGPVHHCHIIAHHWNSILIYSWFLFLVFSFDLQFFFRLLKYSVLTFSFNLVFYHRVCFYIQELACALQVQLLSFHVIFQSNIFCPCLLSSSVSTLCILIQSKV